MGKKRVRLTDEKANLLGLKLNKHDKGRNTARYFLDDRQLKDYYEYKLMSADIDTETKSNEYKKKPMILSAWSEKGFMMDIDEYCKAYKLPRQDISSYKLVSHTGTPFYNIVFKEKINDDYIDLEYIRSILNQELKRTYKFTPKPFNQDKESVLKWADLHFGAHIRNLVLTKDYDSNVLMNGLFESVNTTNNFGFKKVHVHINGDLIESFSGLNHVNSWMSLDKDQVGSNAIMLCCDLLENALSKINNLGSIKIVAGNHDRLSKNNDEDVKGGAAELIAWGLKLKGFDVEFNPYIITHLVDGINHINLHGDKGISKKSTEDILWKYGIKGAFNFIFEAHLHSIIQKLSVSERMKFRTIKDDAIDHRRMHLPSFFTGNYYSESLGFNSNAGYVLTWNNNKGTPNVFNGSI